jgi:hypothetical protein
MSWQLIISSPQKISSRSPSTIYPFKWTHISIKLTKFKTRRPYIYKVLIYHFFNIGIVINVGRKEQKSNIKTVGRFCLFMLYSNYYLVCTIVLKPTSCLSLSMLRTDILFYPIRINTVNLLIKVQSRFVINRTVTQ